VTFLPGEFYPLNFLPNWTYDGRQTHVWLCPKFLVLFFYREFISGPVFFISENSGMDIFILGIPRRSGMTSTAVLLAQRHY